MTDYNTCWIRIRQVTNIQTWHDIVFTFTVRSSKIPSILDSDELCGKMLLIFVACFDSSSNVVGSCWSTNVLMSLLSPLAIILTIWSSGMLALWALARDVNKYSLMSWFPCLTLKKSCSYFENENIEDKYFEKIQETYRCLTYFV